jgi:membrane-associated HD superfamily phosphohydrolase
MNIFQNLARWYFSRRALPYWAILLLDSLIVMGAVALVVFLTEMQFQSLTTKQKKQWTLLHVSVVVLVQLHVKTHQLCFS